MKTKEELNALKEEIETMNKKLAELTEDELKQVVGGVGLSDFEDEKIWFLHDIRDFRKYLVSYKPTNPYPGRIQSVIDKVDIIEEIVMFCESTVDYIECRGYWVGCNKFLELAEAKEVFANEYYIKVQTIMKKYNVV